MPVACQHRTLIIFRGQNSFLISCFQDLLVNKPVFFGPQIRLCSAGNGKKKPDIRMLFPEPDCLKSGYCVKSKRTTAVKPSVSSFICIGNTAENTLCSKVGFFSTQDSVAGEKGGLLNQFCPVVCFWHDFSPSSILQGMLRSGPELFRTGAFFFCLPSVFPEVSFFL